MREKESSNIVKSVSPVEECLKSVWQNKVAQQNRNLTHLIEHEQLQNQLRLPCTFSSSYIGNIFALLCFVRRERDKRKRKRDKGEASAREKRAYVCRDRSHKERGGE